MSSTGTANGYDTAESSASRVLNGEFPHNWVPFSDKPAYTRRKLRMVCIGAGFAGLTLAHKIYHELQLNDSIDLVIYEKNPEVGGVWFENTYPGLSCDVPCHVYNFLFEPNPNWSHFLAPGAEIQDYIQRTTKKWNLDKDIQFNSKVKSTVWDDESGKWKIEIDQLGSLEHDEADILVNASGRNSKYTLPDIEGLSDFKGKIVHTSKWDHDYDWTDKNVAVIGNGSSGIQCVTSLQPKAKSLVSFVRTPTWISSNFLAEKTPNGLNFAYTEEQKKEFSESPEAHFKYRRDLEAGVNVTYHAMRTDNPIHSMMVNDIKRQMEQRMQGIKDPEVVSKMLSIGFTAGCRRLTPGDGYLEAFHDSNATMSFTPIEKITEDGIKTGDGREHKFDLIVCATGSDVNWIPTWKQVGLTGKSLDERWRNNSEAFFSVHVDTMPNYFMINGPNSPFIHGPAHTLMSWTCDYILRWVNKIASEDIKYIDVKYDALEDYNVYVQELLKRTAWSDGCRSWYKSGKNSALITGLYPGSLLHYKESLEKIGGEHFNIEYRSKNRFNFLGNGESVRDEHGMGDLAYYMDEGRV
ncbi:hypothetical protein N7456_013165 [Penicillium angulare]|uniref:FAD/NAD(P)-binding domain-containing protein n=1 Tax=Penicillium angulare TaxID=116970 RepID=A0A9W9EKZ6_9EURO|nr:hypothetical protein N7456_013165 [Penicillium angulare]